MTAPTPRGYLVSPLGGDGEWFEQIDAAREAIADRLRVAPSDLDAFASRTAADPTVVRRDDARWRSAQMWTFRSDVATVRLTEMLRIDEALYDH